MEEGPALGQVPAAASAEDLQLLPGGHQAAGGENQLLPEKPAREQVAEIQPDNAGRFNGRVQTKLWLVFELINDLTCCMINFLQNIILRPKF